MDRVYQKVLGIETGDIITTSYESGPYVVWSLSTPHYCSSDFGALIVRTWPVISLVLHVPSSKNPNKRYWINDVRCEGDRWFSDSNDEIFVEKPANREVLPIDMFLSFPQASDQHTFTPGVDYNAGDAKVWRCGEHGDFNGERASMYGPALCPVCGQFARLIIYMEPRTPGIQQLNAWVRGLNAPKFTNAIQSKENKA